MRYDAFIEWMLNEKGLYFSKRDNYYIHSSFFSKDRTPSSVFYFDGFMEIHNGALPKVNGVGKKRLFITEVAELIGVLPQLVYWIGSRLDVSQYKINKFIELHNGILHDDEYVKYKKEVYKITKNIYLSFDKISNMKSMSNDFDVKKVKAKAKKKKSSIEFTKAKLSEKDAIDNYMKKRRLKIDGKNFKYGSVLINDIFRKPAVILDYDDKYSKARMISGGLRYLTNGEYTKPAKIQFNNSNVAHVVEGYIDAVVFSRYTNKDVYGLDTCTSYKFEDMSSYSHIIIWLDKDQYDEPKVKKYKKLLDCEVIYKSEDGLDFNDQLINNQDVEKNIKKMLDKIS